MGGCEGKADGISATRSKQETLPIGKPQLFLQRWSKLIVTKRGKKVKRGRNRGECDNKGLGEGKTSKRKPI